MPDACADGALCEGREVIKLCSFSSPNSRDAVSVLGDILRPEAAPPTRSFVIGDGLPNAHRDASACLPAFDLVLACPTRSQMPLPACLPSTGEAPNDPTVSDPTV